MFPGTAFFSRTLGFSFSGLNLSVHLSPAHRAQSTPPREGAVLPWGSWVIWPWMHLTQGSGQPYFYMVGKNQNEKNLSWHMKMLWNANFSVRKKVLLQPSLSHSFIFCIWLFLHSVAELSSYNRDQIATKPKTLTIWHCTEPGSQRTAREIFSKLSLFPFIFRKEIRYSPGFSQRNK